MKRNAYLVNQYLKKYMLATILTIAVLQINSTVDSLFMGNFVSPEALAAINVASPALSVIGGLSALVAGGAVVLAGRSLGARDYDSVNQIATTVLLSVVGIGIFNIIVSALVVDYVSNMLCVGNTLFPMVKSYLSVIMGGSVFLILNTALDDLTDVGGNPEIVTQTTVVNCVVNLFMDFVLVANLDMGIAGAATATLMGAAASSLWMWRFMQSGKSPYHLTLQGLKFVATLKGNIKEGLPMLSNSLAGASLMLLLNYFIQKMQGETGMFAMSIILVVMGIGLMLAGGSGAAFMAIGSMLYGRKDYIGLKLLFNRCFIIAVSSSVLSVIVAHFASGTVANLFGASDPCYVEMVERSLPVASWFALSLSILSIMAVVYQVLGHKELCAPAIISLPIFTFIGFMYVYNMDYYDYLWYVFPFAGISSLVITLLMSEFVRRKSGQGLSICSLLPNNDDTGKNMNISARCNQEDISEQLRELREFCEDFIKDVKQIDAVIHPLEELLINIVQHSGRDKKSYIDAGVQINNNEIIAYIQDAGKPFDPTKTYVEPGKIGLKIVRHYCDDISYQYSFGQNTVFLKWSINNEFK